MKTKLLSLLLALLLLVSLTACGGGDSAEAPATPAEDEQPEAETQDPEAEESEPPQTPPPAPDLSGEWKQVNSNSKEDYQTATIQGDVIEVFWISETDETKALYWSGTYIAPTTDETPYTWESQNDKDKTGMAILASGDDTKTFTYEDNQISYSVSAMGVTSTVRLEKQ